MNINEASEVCKVLSDPHRIRILQLLVDGDKCASELLGEFTISQPTLSHHMKTMTDSGLLQEKKIGKRTYYSIDRRTWDEFMLVLDTISSKDYWPWDPAQVLRENAQAASGQPPETAAPAAPGPEAAPADPSAPWEKAAVPPAASGQAGAPAEKPAAKPAAKPARKKTK